jgi:hypothetical protein
VKQIISFSFLMLCLSAQDYAGNFMYLDQGAKTTASGNAFFTNQNDLSAFRYYPADYSFGTTQKVYSIYSSRFSGLYDQFHLGYTQPLFGGYNITLNWNYSGVSDIPRYNALKIDDSTGLPEQRSPDGFFNNNNHISSIIFGKVFDNIVDFGWDYFEIPLRFPTSLSVNYASTSIDEYSAYAFTFDLSTGVSFNLGELFIQNSGVGNFSFFMTYMNVAGTDLIWDDVSSFDGSSGTKVQSNEYLPSNTIFGFNVILPQEDIETDFGFAYQRQTLYERDNYGILINYQKFLEFRFGLNDNKFTTGLGVKAYDAEVFLSFQPRHSLGSTFLLDLSYEIK